MPLPNEDAMEVEACSTTSSYNRSPSKTQPLTHLHDSTFDSFSSCQGSPASYQGGVIVTDVMMKEEERLQAEKEEVVEEKKKVWE